MAEYVYALHDFKPENEDEVDFSAGERIEVVEKDDMYGDGWWQGRNLAGKVGLFPVSYTTPVPSAPAAPPPAAISQSNSAATTVPDAGAARSVLQPLREESEPDISPPIASPIPKPPPEPTFLDDQHGESFNGVPIPTSPDGEMMKATMTDVQKAIEQLGRGGAGPEDQRSFSFASTRDGGDTETDTDFDLSDLDGAADGPDGTEDWHKNARRKLAAKAKRAIEEAEKLEAIMNGNSDLSLRRAAPPIEVELSDESDVEDEGDYTRASRFQKIVEEDEEEESRSAPTHTRSSLSATETKRSSAADTHIDLALPPKDETEMPTATAATVTFPEFVPPQVAATSTPAIEQTPQQPAPAADPTPETEQVIEAPASKSSYPTPISPAPMTAYTLSSSTAASSQQQPQDDAKRNSAPYAPITNGLPSPSASSHFNQSKHTSIISSSSAPGLSTPAPVIALTPTKEEKKEVASPVGKTHPSDWTVEEVVEWLKSKGFDHDVCEKFTEQEITGDVLLELDVNVLKNEIGIMAFGKRMRIANAIAELRRPPSIEYSDHHHSSEHPSPMHSSSQFHGMQHLSHHASHGGPSGGGPLPMMHSRTQSQGQQSHHSFPGSIGGSGYAPSPSSPIGSSYPPHVQFGGNSNGISPRGSTTLHESSAASATGSGSDAGVAGVGAGGGSGPFAVGLGINGRQAHLALSPSDGALKDSAAGVLAPTRQVEDEDRGHMSDGDVVPTATSMRRRLFGRSHDSAVSVVKSGRGSPLPSPTVLEGESYKEKESVKSGKKGKDEKDKDKEDEKEKKETVGTRHARAKKSVDAGRAGDRLSIFGGTFSGSLGKNRKPVPTTMDDGAGDRSSKFMLPRLHGPSSMRKASANSQRPSTPDKSPKEHKSSSVKSPVGDSPVKDKDGHATLRKRTSSAPHAVPHSSGHGIGHGLGSAAATAAAVNGLSASSSSGGAGAGAEVNGIKQGQSILEQIGEPDHAGWMRKRGERYNAWKLRYFVIKGPHMYCLKSNNRTETRIKGYIHIVGYKVTVDENVDPGRYGFRIDHDNDKTHYFSSDEKTIVRDWMKAIMKATIGRDYTKPVVSSCNIPTIPLVVAQAMNPAPRPPSPTARDATQKALRRENPGQLSSRDARVLMGLPGGDREDNGNGNGNGRARLDSFFDGSNALEGEPGSSPPVSPRRSTAAPPRPSREMRRTSSIRTATNIADDSLIDWANSHLPYQLQIVDPNGPLCGGLALLRLAESIRGRPSSPPVPDSAFPLDPNDDKLDGLFRLFDFLLDNDVKMGSVSINDVRQGKRDKIVQLLKALKAWEDKRKALANTISKGITPTGGYITPLVI